MPITVVNVCNDSLSPRDFDIIYSSFTTIQNSETTVRQQINADEGPLSVIFLPHLGDGVTECRREQRHADHKEEAAEEHDT